MTDESDLREQAEQFGWGIRGEIPNGFTLMRGRRHIVVRFIGGKLNTVRTNLDDTGAWQKGLIRNVTGADKANWVLQQLATL